MADRTIRAIFEARVSGAQKGMRDLAGDVDKTGKKVEGLDKDLKGLDAITAKPKVDAEIDSAEKDVKTIQNRLDDLDKLEATPEVTADVARARRDLADAEGRLSSLRGAKAEMIVQADVTPAKDALEDLGDEGEDAGREAGKGLSGGILGALIAIPVAGAVLGVGVAIGAALFGAIQDGLAIEARGDLFTARTGLDEGTARKFGRAAGEAYSQAWGESIAENLETARIAMEQGLIDPDDSEADITKVIGQLTGITDILQADIPAAARAAGQMVKTGMSKDLDDAFDVLVAGYQSGADASQDLLDTLIEYPTHFRDLGLSGQDAVGLLVQGLDAGAFNADKVADALKELTIRVKDVDDAAAGEALLKLGLDHQEMSRRFAAGGPEARAALDDILDGLRGIEDPAERSALAVDLFGTQAEDMAAALTALDLSTAAQELDGIEGSAGAAQRALATMADNDATRIEEARRNIEVAANGIKGALASAFSDEIGGAAQWVARNRGPIMQFFSDAINGAFNFARSVVEGMATAYESMIGFAAEAGIPIINMLAQVAVAFDKAIPGDQGSTEFREWADGAILNLQRLNTEAPVTADRMRETLGGALEDTQAKFNEWAGPEIMAAHIHDATMAMSEDMDTFSAKVEESGGTVTINGESYNAEEALDLLVSNINGEDGTVTINGTPVPAENALETLMAAISQKEADVKVGANTWQAERDLAYAARARSATIYATVRVNSDGFYVWASGAMAGIHDGGYVKGLNTGGFVPGSDPGYDNVLWPLNTGGTTLMQPLAGGEYVVNSEDAKFWGPILEWMNAGGRPSGGGARDRGTNQVNVYAVPTDHAEEVARSVMWELNRYESGGVYNERRLVNG